MPRIAVPVIIVHTRRNERIAVSPMQHDIIRHDLQQSVFHSVCFRE